MDGFTTHFTSVNLSQVYFSNLQWADMETCQLNPASIKSPLPATFPVCSETTGFYGCLGKGFCEMYPGESHCLIRNITSALPEIWDETMDVQQLWTGDGLVILSMGVAHPHFLLSVWCPYNKYCHDQYWSPLSQEHGLRVTLTSSEVKSAILQLADP